MNILKLTLTLGCCVLFGMAQAQTPKGPKAKHTKPWERKPLTSSVITISKPQIAPPKSKNVKQWRIAKNKKQVPIVGRDQPKRAFQLKQTRKKM